jgi:hypothetical protein
MNVRRDGKTVTLREDDKRAKVRFVKSHEAAQYRNAISLENKKSYDEAIRLIRRYNGVKII